MDPMAGLCSVWLAIKCILGSQTPDLCKNIIFKNQLLFNFDSSVNRFTIHNFLPVLSTETDLVVHHPYHRHKFLGFGMQPCSQKPPDCVDTEKMERRMVHWSWKEVGFWIWYFWKDLVIVTPICILLTIKWYRILSWDLLISFNVLELLLTLAFGHYPLSSSGAK